MSTKPTAEAGVEYDDKNWFDNITGITLEQLDQIGDTLILAGMIPKEMMTLIHSPGGAGKSTLVAALVALIMKEDIDIDIVYLDYDGAVIRNRKMFEQLLILDAKNKRSRIKIDSVRTKKHSDEIMRRLASEDLTNVVVVIDALQGLFDRYQKKINDSGDAGMIMDLLKALRDQGATVIPIHHSNKDTGEGIPKFRGSAVILDAVDSLYRLALIDRTPDVLTVGLDFSQKFVLPFKDMKVTYRIDRELNMTSEASVVQETDQLPKNITEEHVKTVLKCIEDSNDDDPLLTIETMAKDELGFGIRKIKGIFTYALSAELIEKEHVEGYARRYTYKLKDNK